MSILSTAEIESITKDIEEIIGDDVIGTTISYQLAGATMETGYDPVTQEVVTSSMYATSSVSAFKGTYSIDEVEKSGGLIEQSDVKFIIMTSSVSGILSSVDRVYEKGNSYQGGTTYQVVGPLRRDPLNICYFLQCRAV